MEYNYEHSSTLL